jgi:hypothetical protein
MAENCGQSSDDSRISGGAGEVEPEGSVLLADPNLTCPCLKVEGDLFVDFTSGVGRREYLDAISGARVRHVSVSASWPRSGASHATSMALTPSGVETGHSVTTCPFGNNCSKRVPILFCFLPCAGAGEGLMRMCPCRSVSTRYGKRASSESASN